MFESISRFVNNLFGTKSERDIKELQPVVDKINEAYGTIVKLSNDELRAKTEIFKSYIKDYVKAEREETEAINEQLENDQTLDIDKKEDLYKRIDDLEKIINTKTEEALEEILPEAFAVVKETARRYKENRYIEVTATDFDRNIATIKNNVTIVGDKAQWANTWLAAGTEVKWEMMHYDVQLIGGIVLHRGKIAEMATGEGKTLVGTLPVYLNALTGKGVHLVTVNDYLAKRDSEWMAPLFEFHGMRVDCIDKHQPNSNERRNAYLADITYGTNNEFGFDYLRDNMASTPEELVQRKHNFAIVDEVDSVLIDDARTPLIISGPTPKGDIHEFLELKPKVEKLINAQRTLINTLLTDAKKQLNDELNDKLDKKEAQKNIDNGAMALLRAFRGFPRNKALIKFLSEPGMRAILQKTENHYLQDNAKEMVKVDEALYFVIDEKQNQIELTEKGIDLITGNSEDPKFFIMPDITAELAGLDKLGLDVKQKAERKETIISDFTIKSERIHTVNQLLKAYSLFERDNEYVVMDNKVKIVDEQTGRIMDGRRYSDGLHQAIEAKENVKIEAATQTYATVSLQNYFRMYHKLAGMTGTAETESAEFWEIYKLDVVVIPTNRAISRADMEDKVYKTKREKYNAVIEEIVDLQKKGRPVLVGTTNVEVSELLSKMLRLRKIDHQVLNAKLHQKEADIVSSAGVAGAVTIATNMAGRGTDIKLGTGVKESGGLAIIGTERHESRRVDRQLRGRAGRQGDPGSSQFFVSLEDDLMRLFGSERIASLMDRMGLEEGEVIQHSMITKSIERAQRKVEENHFGTRKRLLEYDDVMNSQREVIYKRRRNALYGKRMEVEIAHAIYNVVESIVTEQVEMRDFENFNFELLRQLSIESPVNEDKFLSGNIENLIDQTFDVALAHYNEKSKMIAEMVYPVVKDVFENQSAQFKNIVIPFTDNRKTLQVVAPLEKSYKTHGLELIRSLEKSATLAMIDNAWKEHLRDMDDLRQSVQSAVYEQKDPLLVYKFESFDLFKSMVTEVNKELSNFIIKAQVPLQQSNAVRQAPEPKRVENSQIRTSRADLPVASNNSESQQAAPEQEKPKPQPVRVEKKVGRNDPCPCGSGKKFKQCHGIGQ